jgi:sialidase-1
MSKPVTHDLPHSPGNSRNSEGAFETLKDGRILFAYTRYVEGGGKDDDKADIAGLTSSDGGRTWPGEPRILVPNEGARNVMSVSLLRLQDGRLALFYLRKNGWDDCCPFLRISPDEGETWGPPVRTISYKGYFILNNDRVIQLRNGRILLPIAEHRNSDRVGGEGGRFFDQRGTFFVVWSDDGGQTWVEGAERWTLPSGRDYLQEPGAIELKDGRLWVFLRTNTGRQWQTFSSDQGASWTLPKPSRFHSPKAPLSMKRNPATGDLLAVWDDTALAVKLWGAEKKLPADGWGRDKSWGRTPLVMAVSRDDGKTWSRSRILEREPDHGYCYIAIHFVEGAVLLAYCCGGGESSHVLQDLRIRRIPLT